MFHSRSPWTCVHSLVLVLAHRPFLARRHISRQPIGKDGLVLFNTVSGPLDEVDDITGFRLQLSRAWRLCRKAYSTFSSEDGRQVNVTIDPGSMLGEITFHFLDEAIPQKATRSWLAWPTASSEKTEPLENFNASLSEVELLSLESFTLRKNKFLTLYHDASVAFIDALRGCTALAFHGESAMSPEPIQVRAVLNDKNYAFGWQKAFGQRLYEEAKLGELERLGRSWANVALRLKHGDFSLQVVKLLSTTFWPSVGMMTAFTKRFEEKEARSKRGYMVGLEGLNANNKPCATVLSADLFNTRSLDELPFLLVETPTDHFGAELLVVHLPTYVRVSATEGFSSVRVFSDIVWLAAPSRRGLVELHCNLVYSLDLKEHHSSVTLKPRKSTPDTSLSAESLLAERLCTLDQTIHEVSNFDLLAFERI